MRATLGKLFLRLGERMALGYDGADSQRFRKDLGWGRSSPRDEDALVVSDGSRERLRLKAADLRRNNPIVAGVCERLASFAVGTGIVPQAATKDRTWNRLAEDYFKQRAKIIDSRQRCSLWQLQRLAVSLRPTHGGLYLELLENGQVRPIECERIRQPQDPKEAGNYVDGVRVDPATGIRTGYLVHSRDRNGGFSEKHAERFVPASNIKPVVTPSWRPDQVREIPDFAPIIPALSDVHEMNLYTLNTAKVQSHYIGVMKRHGGAGVNSSARGTASPTVGARQTFKTDWGEIREMFPGEELDLKVSPTPGTNHIPYMKLQLSLAAAALDVPYEFFTLDFSTADFSRQKAILMLVNKTMRGWQAWLNESMNQPLWNWTIAKAMRNGDLPPAPVVDGVSQWFRVDWQAPEEPWSDRQEAQQADVLEIQMGVNTLGRACKRRGYDLEDTLRAKAEENKLIDEIAAEFGMSPERLSKMQIPGQTPEGGKKPEDRGQRSEDRGRIEEPEEDAA